MNVPMFWHVEINLKKKPTSGLTFLKFQTRVMTIVVIVAPGDTPWFRNAPAYLLLFMAP